jgi:uncharacterized protein
MSDMPPLNVVHDGPAQHFHATVEGLRCVVDYQLRDGVMWVTHTGVPPALEGRGIAAALVKQALAWADAMGLKVVPQCSYVRVYMRRHPETLHLMHDA